MGSVATGSKVILFAVLEFTSMEDCNRARDLLVPAIHHDLMYECEWDLQSSVFYYHHSQIHTHFSVIPPDRPERLDHYPTNAK